MTVPRTAELVIVGAGVIGAATAFAARRAGLDPLVFEARNEPAAATTAAATGAYRLQQDDPDELAIIRETVAAMQDFAEFTGQTRYDPAPRAAGLMSLTTTEEGAAAQAETVAHQRSIGVDGIELLDGAAARARFPYLAARGTAGAPADGGRAARSAPARARPARGRAGRHPLPRRPASSIDGGVTAVHTERGTISTPACVIACGPMSGVVARLAGLELPIGVLLRHKAVLPDVPQVPHWAPLTFDEDTGAHWRPARGGAYLLISLSGQEPGEAVDDPIADADFVDRVLAPSSPTSVARLSPFWRDVWERAPRDDWTVQCGLYTVTPDHRPLIDETPVPGLYVNTGYSGHGVMSSIGGARHLVERIMGAMVSNPFALDRTFVPPRGKAR